MARTKSILILGHSENPPTKVVTESLHLHNVQTKVIRTPYAEAYPHAELIDGLVIMGGPTSIYKWHELDWLEKELKWVEQFLGTGKPVFGICFGVQMLAHLAGGEVMQGSKGREFGFSKLTAVNGDDPIFGDELNDQFVFQDHGDTYRLPRSATPLLEGEVYSNQAAKFADNVFGIQGHPEVSVEHCLRFQARFEPPEKEIEDLRQAATQYTPITNNWMHHLFGRLFL